MDSSFGNINQLTAHDLLCDEDMGDDQRFDGPDEEEVCRWHIQGIPCPLHPNDARNFPANWCGNCPPECTSPASLIRIAVKPQEDGTSSHPNKVSPNRQNQRNQTKTYSDSQTSPSISLSGSFRTSM